MLGNLENFKVICENQLKYKIDNLKVFSYYMVIHISKTITYSVDKNKLQALVYLGHGIDFVCFQFGF